MQAMIKRAWSRMPTWAKVVVVFAAIGILGRIVGGPAQPAMPQSKPATIVTTPAKKSLGERVFSTSLDAYTDKDGVILVSFDAWTMSKDSVEGDIRKFMDALTREKRSDWTEVTISAKATSTDKYGAQSKVVVYTITFFRSEALLVKDWNRANIVLVGLREFAVPQLQ
jgi:hypothetical protein